MYIDTFNIYELFLKTKKLYSFILIFASVL